MRLSYRELLYGGKQRMLIMNSPRSLPEEKQVRQHPLSAGVGFNLIRVVPRNLSFRLFGDEGFFI